MDDPILSIKNFSFHYAVGTELFSHANFDLGSQDRVGLYGRNGCGKTTLLRLLTGLEKPLSGEVRWRGRSVVSSEDWHNLRCHVGYVLQNSADQLFSPTVLEDVAFGPINLGMPKAEVRQWCMEILDKLGITRLAPRACASLSGGEAKMVALASVLSMRPNVLLLDEPTIFLDDASRDRFIAVLKLLSLPFLVVSHEKDFLGEVANRFLTVSDGKLIEWKHR